MDAQSDDVRAIEAIVERQFGSLNWRHGTTGDWEAFASDFHQEATLFPSKRPARRQTVEEFVTRMQGLVGTSLRAFDEKVLGTDIRVFGNVAVAVAACEITENDTDLSRGVEMLLLVKDDGAWWIVSQAWDMEGPDKPIPRHLLTGPA
jgi:hypothetical protein